MSDRLHAALIDDDAAVLDALRYYLARQAIRQHPPVEERTKLVTREDRIDDFIHEGSPPNDQPLQILCEDHVGTYVIPFPCRWRDGLWENAKTSRRIEATVVGWRALNKPQR